MSGLGTKSETLKFLRDSGFEKNVLPLVYFNWSEWNLDKSIIHCRLQEFLNEHKVLVVRSSAKSEDNFLQSNAGGYDSFLGINSISSLEDAVIKVFKSFGDNKLDEDQVLIQPQLMDVSVSGVLFTRDLSTMAPYYIINYDDKSHRTDTVTSGSSNDLKMFTCFKNQVNKHRFSGLISVVSTIEEKLDCDHLDIEFALSSEGSVYIFQVRPLVRRGKRLPNVLELTAYLDKIAKKVEKIIAPHPYMLGKKGMLGVMTDWNPAEMIGTRPRPLALSFYKDLITDKTWAYQRDNYGYRNLRSFPLIHSLIGIPYVDIRASFNSFIPKSISNRVADKLCEHYLRTLQDNPHCHDKIEFDIVMSCFVPSIDSWLGTLGGFEVSEKNEIKKSLFDLTKNIISRNGIFFDDIHKVKMLSEKQNTISGSEITTIEKIYWIIEDCRRFGTLPFAGIARSAFIAVQWLRSLVDERYITREEYDEFMLSISTISKEMSQDLVKKTRQDFIQKYGHLRPGTYDILSPSYQESFDVYFSEKTSVNIEEKEWKLGLESQIKLNDWLAKLGFEFDADHLFYFFKEAIEWRERAKFIFTKSVHLALELIKDLGERYGFSKDDMSFISINTLTSLYSNLDQRDLYQLLKQEIEHNKAVFEVTKLLRLPDFIADPSDVWAHLIEEAVPNFVTLNIFQGQVVKEEDFSKQDLKGKIVFIKSADPGYDWIFSKNIGALVTMYGGANSHMAIRASELGIPSVIGAGEKKYSEWSASNLLSIDCEKKIVMGLK